MPIEGYFNFEITLRGSGSEKLQEISGLLAMVEAQSTETPSTIMGGLSDAESSPKSGPVDGMESTIQKTPESWLFRLRSTESSHVVRGISSVLEQLTCNHLWVDTSLSCLRCPASRYGGSIAVRVANTDTLTYLRKALEYYAEATYAGQLKG